MNKEAENRFLKEIERQVRDNCADNPLIAISLNAAGTVVEREGLATMREVMFWRNDPKTNKKIQAFVNKIGKEYGLKYDVHSNCMR